jgi:hypothetical protein
MPQMRHVEAAQIAQFDPFELRPYALPRVQVRCISGQALHVHPLSRTIREELLDKMAAVNRRAVPDDDHAVGHLAQQVFQEGHHVRRIDRVVLAVEVQLAFRREGREGREVIARPPLPQDRGLPYGGIRAHHTGQGINARFVSTQDRVLRRLGPFLMADQVSSRQCAIATSSR